MTEEEQQVGYESVSAGPWVVRVVCKEVRAMLLLSFDSAHCVASVNFSAWKGAVGEYFVRSNVGCESVGCRALVDVANRKRRRKLSFEYLR